MAALPFFDTHFHLNPEDDLAQMLVAADEAGVGGLLLAGASVGRLEAALGRIAPYPQVYAAVGVHPHEAAKFDGDLSPYRTWTTESQVRAIGEIGLDFFYDYGPPEAQRRCFAQFLELARESGLPAIVHCREAYEECYAMLDSVLQGHPFVVHCFSGTPEWAERFLAIGGHLSFTGLITFKKADNVREALAVVPLDRLMFETDSPYLAPVPFRGKQNQPAYVANVVRYAAEFLQVPLDELTATTTNNALRFFGIDQLPEPILPPKTP